MNDTDIKSIVSIIREVLHGYYVIIFRDTVSYKVCKLHKEEFIGLFKDDVDKWVVETRDELTRFLLISPDDPTASESEMLQTFSTYNVDGTTKIARQSIVCDWVVYELVFGSEQPESVLKLAHTEKI